MRITSLNINHFRGIESAFINFPMDQRIVCVIGSGDSGKSTMLTAMEWALWPSWNLNVTDLDFYEGNTQKCIEIMVTVTEVPDTLLNEEKFGLYLRNAAAIATNSDNDEPVDGGVHALTIRLSIDDSLEPKWEVITNRTEPKQISHKDRQLLSIGIVGNDYEKDFVWGRNSILHKYTDSKTVLHNAYKAAIREITQKAEFSELDKTSNILKSTGMQYGVSINGELHNKILMQNGSFSTTVGVFDGAVPFVYRGLGSKRLLSIGMNINFADGASVLLIDEIETGLEPYRICGLINEFRRTHNDCGQVIMTTHSQSVITECSIGELSILNSCDGIVKYSVLKSDNSDVNNIVQGMLRTDPSAFLCKRLIVCEGKTEIGLLRAFDSYNSRKKGVRFSYFGVGVAYGGGGDKMFKFTNLLKNSGYDVSILMDSDLSEENIIKDEFRARGIEIFDWEEGNAIEDQIFQDVPVEVLNKVMNLVVNNKGIQHIMVKLKDLSPSEYVSYNGDVISLSEEIPQNVKKQLGNIAKKHGCEWFKRIDLGEDLGIILFSNIELISSDSFFVKTLMKLEKWVEHHERE